MYSLVRRYIKTAFAFLVVGLGIGVWIIYAREFRGAASSQYVISAHTHAVFVGFVMMMILGVALWLFPRPEKGDTRYRPQLANAAYWLLTLGTAVRIAGELLRTRDDSFALRAAVVASGVTQVVAICIYTFTIWSRIRAVGSAVRESKGERF